MREIKFTKKRNNEKIKPFILSIGQVAQYDEKNFLVSQFLSENTFIEIIFKSRGTRL